MLGREGSYLSEELLKDYLLKGMLVCHPSCLGG